MQESLKAWQVPGASLAIVRGDEVVYLKGYGVKEQGSEKTVTADTLFAIGSTTKAFTTTAMAMLIDEGKMSWDDHVRKHIPFFRLSDALANEYVTLRDIVSHRTGLSRNDLLWYNSPWGRERSYARSGWSSLTARSAPHTSIKTSCFDRRLRRGAASKSTLKSSCRSAYSTLWQ